MLLISSYNWFIHYLIVRKIVLFISRTIFFGLELVHVCLQLFKTPLIRWRFYSYNEENSLGEAVWKSKIGKRKTRLADTFSVIEMLWYKCSIFISYDWGVGWGLFLYFCFFLFVPSLFFPSCTKKNSVQKGNKLRIL